MSSLYKLNFVHKPDDCVYIVCVVILAVCNDVCNMYVVHTL